LKSSGKELIKMYEGIKIIWLSFIGIGLASFTFPWYSWINTTGVFIFVALMALGLIYDIIRS
jgi:hypothetical protein